MNQTDQIISPPNCFAKTAVSTQRRKAMQNATHARGDARTYIQTYSTDGSNFITGGKCQSPDQVAATPNGYQFHLSTLQRRRPRQSVLRVVVR